MKADTGYKREKELCRKFWDPAGIQTRDLSNASWMLLPLSHWTHGGGAETRIHIAALVNCGREGQLESAESSDQYWYM